jgi:hypothetical protein
MEVIFRVCLCFATTFAFALGSICMPARSAADPGVTVFPGMEMYQDDTACTVGFVETRLRIALTAGQCRGGSTVTDSHQQVLGAVVQAHRNTAEGAAADGSVQSVEYEVIALAPNVTASDVLPTGRQLQSTPSLRAELALPVCRFEASNGQTCGRISAVGNGRFVIADMAPGDSESGGPVYALTEDNRAVIVGLLKGMGGSMPEAESWQAVMQQLYIDSHADAHAPGPQAPPLAFV